jgi:uncharacterized repeat protein (TIGR02543 family)
MYYIPTGELMNEWSRSFNLQQQSDGSYTITENLSQGVISLVIDQLHLDPESGVFAVEEPVEILGTDMYGNVSYSEFVLGYMTQDSIILIAESGSIRQGVKSPLLHTEMRMAKYYEYSPTDVAVINRIITENGLQESNVDEPENWSFVAWSNSIPKRIERVTILPNYTMSGEVNLSELSELQLLNIANAESINVSGCTKLTTLAALFFNSLNVDGCSKLEQLSWTGSNAQTIDLSSCVSLKILAGDNLTSLDVSNNSNLTLLFCVGNHLTSLDLSNQTALTSFAGNAQTVSLSLTGTAENGYSLALPLNNPTFDNAAVSYANGVLTCTDNSVTSVEFTVETGLAGYQLSGTITFDYAEKAPAYFVTFSGEEITIEQQEIEHGSVASRPGNPTREGYDFVGWFTEPACENEWDFATNTVTAHTTLYAKWVLHTETGVETVQAPAVQPVAYYNLLGQKLNAAPEKGIFLVKYADGRVEKVFK